jgi:hypothetical protein
MGQRSTNDKTRFLANDGYVHIRHELLGHHGRRPSGSAASYNYELFTFFHDASMDWFDKA